MNTFWVLKSHNGLHLTFGMWFVSIKLPACLMHVNSLSVVLFSPLLKLSRDFSFDISWTKSPILNHKTLTIWENQHLFFKQMPQYPLFPDHHTRNNQAGINILFCILLGQNDITLTVWCYVFMNVFSSSMCLVLSNSGVVTLLASLICCWLMKKVWWRTWAINQAWAAAITFPWYSVWPATQWDPFLLNPLQTTTKK